MSLRKKPWNRTDHPVYAVSSRNGNEQNMHIISYATAISMQPKRYVVGIFEGTKTLELISANPEFVLQILSKEQYPLVRLLGQQSGHSINKIARLQKRNLITEWKGFSVLKDALAFLHLKAIDQFNGGDHTGFLCEVIAYKNMNEGVPLTLNVLREKQIIRG
jgi:flavin reductase (DIM6/NTAB) family NADH-FMN oxidoreductase RutF